MSSSFRLRTLNLFVGMCRGTPGLSGALRGIGYRDLWINGGLPRERRSRSHPPFVLASRKMRHSLFLEVTPGPTVDSDRLDAYERITAVELRDGTQLSREQTETYGVAVVGRAEHRDTLLEGVEDRRTRPALLLCTPEGLVLEANPFMKSALTNIFRPLLPVDWPYVPLSWIPFDHESGSAQVAEMVVPWVVARLLRGQTLIDVGEVCAGQTLWSLTTDEGRQRLRARIEDVLAEAARHEMGSYFTLRGNAVIATTALSQDEGQAGDGTPVNLRTLRILSMRHAALLERLGG